MTHTTLPEARLAMLSSFAELARTRRYGEIGVSCIVRAAKVARSTFYYHFGSKDDLLLENLQPLIEVLAGAAFKAVPSLDLLHWIEHVWDNRLQAARLLKGRTGAKLHARLVQALQMRLGEIDHVEAVRAAMWSEQIAGSTMSLLHAWTTHRFSATPTMIGRTLSEFPREALSR